MDGDTLTGVEITRLGEGTKRVLETDQLLVFFGLSPKLGPIAEWGLEMGRKTIGVDTATFETNIPGIFAIGDIVSYPGKLKLILTGFAEAAAAAHAIYHLLHPDQALHFEHSTTKGVPGSS